MPAEADIEMPWIRDALVQHLERLAKPGWIESVTGPSGTSQEMDDILDFFDDSGLLGDPGQCIGVVLRNQDEALALAEIADVLEHVLRAGGGLGWGELAQASRRSLPKFERRE